MKKFMIAGLSAFGLLAGSAVLLSQTGENAAYAQASAKATVDAAKARGEVAERIDGYLEARGDAPADVQRAVNEINIGRKAAYTESARRNNTSVEVFAQLTGEKLIAATPSGQYVIRADGQWSRK